MRRMVNQLGTQEEGEKSTAVSFPLVIKLKFNRLIEERNYFRKLLLADLATAPKNLF
jgi:hypothetical protein